MGPCDVVRESDPDARETRELSTVDVDLVRHGQVDLGEAELALPREVGVGDERAPGAAFDPIRADCPCVRAEVRGGERGEVRCSGGRVGGGDGLVVRWGRWLRACYVVGEFGAACEQCEAPRIGIDLDRLDRTNPLGVGAPSRQAGATGVAEVLIPARRERLELFDDVGRGVGEVGCRDSGHVDGAPGEVALDVLAVAARPEVPGPFTAHFEDLVEQCAPVVLATDVSLAVGEVGAVASADVRYTVGRSADRRLERRVEPWCSSWSSS